MPKLRVKHIDAAREVRLWISQVIVPGVVAGVAAKPIVDEFVAPRVRNMKHKVTNKIQKKKVQRKGYTAEEIREFDDAYDRIDRLTKMADDLNNRAQRL